MPEISRFFGIVIRMYFDDHNPPHFHAYYSGQDAQFGIDPIAGSAPVREYPAAGVSETMLPRITRASYAGEYRLELTFTDGVVKEVDFRERIVGRGGVFHPLEDVMFFQQVQVDHEAGTVVWPNGVDFCPDVLYSLAMGIPIRVAQHA